MASIEKFCVLASRNVDTLTDEDRKLLAKALDLKVRIDPERVSIDGIIPIVDNIDSDYLTSRCSASARARQFSH